MSRFTSQLDQTAQLEIYINPILMENMERRLLRSWQIRCHRYLCKTICSFIWSWI